MAYSELIKNFHNIRNYMRDFYVYGFKNRSQYNLKSARSYDNERRRIESWLGKYMSFNRDANGKNVFLAVDSRMVPSNPLYEAFKAKSFTDNDIMLYFYLLDILRTYPNSDIKTISEKLTDEYLSAFDEAKVLDDSTLRKKLDEYVGLGIVTKSKQGKSVYYALADNALELAPYLDAIKFFSEAGELGVFGSYLLDTKQPEDNVLIFKHHYILHALESEILLDLMEAINQKLSIEIQTSSANNISTLKVMPFKIFVSVQSGRRYLLGYSYTSKNIGAFRLDNISAIKAYKQDESYDQKLAEAQSCFKHMWGVAGISNNAKLEHIAMTIRIGKTEQYMLRRLEREKRCGTITKLDDELYKFTADVYNAMELIPWINTFIGRIVSFKCSNKIVTVQFHKTLKKLYEMYLD